jgi:SNF2 family DNA or RNA helicase
LARLLAAGVDTLVLDEVSKMKHAQTRRFKALKPFLGGFKRRWGLTGTPCANSLLDLFGVCYTLDLGRALGRFITHFRTSYFVPGGYGNYTWRPQPGAEARIFAAIAPLAQSLKAVDVLDDLPTLVERDIYVELPPPARKAYDELEKDLITVINTTTVMAPNVAAALNRCRQLTGGAIYHTPEVAHGRAWLPVHDEKVAAVVDLVEELQGAPLLVAYDFIHELERLRAALGAHTPALGGGISAREAADAIALWNTGAAPVMLVHPAAAGHGLNLQSGGGCNVCFFTSPWDYELYTQCVARIWRQGNTAPRVIVHRLIARKTVDLAVRDALTRKERNQEALFAALRRPAWRGGRDA